MAFNLTAGNPRAHRIRVYYTESSTIYEGMPVCYEFDATTNWFGGSVNQQVSSGTAGEITATTTTAEGSQNEGKYIRVEDVDADNDHAFAGVVAKGGWVGKTGPRALDIYVPNGAIVPVRTDQNCTVGLTILSIHTAEQHTTGPYGTAGRPVAIAAESVDRSSTTGICLAVLDPGMFLFQKGDGTSLSVDDQDAANNMIINRINVTTASTAAFCAFECRAYSTAGAYANLTSGGGLAAYFRAGISATVTQAVNAVGVLLDITGGTPTEYLAGLHIKVAETGATLTSCSKISALSLEFQVTNNVQTYRHAWISLANNGTQTPDALIHATNLTTLNAQAFTGNVTIGSTAGDYAIPVYLQSQPGTQLWYIPLVKALA